VAVPGRWVTNAVRHGFGNAPPHGFEDGRSERGSWPGKAASPGHRGHFSEDGNGS